MKSHRRRPTVLLVVNLQNGKEGFLRNFHAAHLLHALLAGFLLFEQLLLTRDIATVALRQHVLSQSLHVFAGNDVGADGGQCSGMTVAEAKTTLLRAIDKYFEE